MLIGLSEPTAIAFTPDGRMLIAERGGRVLIRQPGATQVDVVPLLQIVNINTAEGERGLVGLALDPDFAANGYYYLFYTADTPLRDRVSRFTAAGNTTVPNSEVVIWQDDLAAGLWHHGGTVAIGPDGRLYISTGDHFDSSSGASHVSQRLNSYRGKILRFNLDGSIPADNPFYDGAGPNYDAIWARGLRNPFRFSFDPLSGAIYIGDNGNNDGQAIEELNSGGPGANFGWPICQGPCSTSGMTNPIFSYSHSGRDASIIAGPVYRAGQFPGEYTGSFFYADYAQNWIRRLTFDAAGNVNGNLPFEPADGAQDGPYGEIVDLKIGPDGALYYVDIGIPWIGTPTLGTVRRIASTLINQAPTIASASASPPSGPGPTLTVAFSATATDPEGSPLTYTWDFGDGASAQAANPTHTYTQRGRYSARLSVSDGANQVFSAPLVIVVGNPPTATIDTPANGRLFRAGDVISFSGSAADVDEALGPASFAWSLALRHADHVHPASAPILGVTTGSFAIPSTGHDFSENTYYELVLKVTDSEGLVATSSVFLYPERVAITLETDPPGLAIGIDQSTGLIAPYTQNTLIGFQHQLTAPLQQSISGDLYQFVAWSDGGAAAHTITVPDAPQTYTAIYQAVASPTPTATGTPTETPTPTPSATLAPSATATPTPSATPPISDGIFADDFEAGSLGGWGAATTDGGDLAVTAAAALNGAFGMVATIDDNTAIYVTDTSPAAEARYRARFYLDPNSITMANGNAFYLLRSYAGASTEVLRVELRRSSSTYQLRSSLRNDASTWTSTAWFTISDAAHAVEIDWRAATAAGANNGGVTLWIDGAQRASITTTDNDTRRVDLVRLGAVAGIDSGTRGLLLFDAFESRRQTYIGPVATSPPTATVTPTRTATAAPSATGTATPSPVATSTATLTPVATAAPSATPTQTATALPTSTATAAPTAPPTATATASATTTPGGAFGLTFDGVNDLLRAGQVAGTGPLTVEAWVRPAAAGANAIIVANSDDTTGWSLEINNGQLTFWLATNQGWQLNRHTAALQVGQWYHVAATYQSGSARTFVNGVAATATTVGTLTQGPALSIGGLPGYPSFRGDLDELRISNSVRYSAAFTPPAGAFVADTATRGLWHFDEGSGQTALDVSASANHATLGTSASDDSADPAWLTGGRFP